MQERNGLFYAHDNPYEGCKQKERCAYGPAHMGLYPRQVPTFERSHKHSANIAILVIILIEITDKEGKIQFC